MCVSSGGVYPPDPEADTPLPHREQNYGDRWKNITLAQTSFAGGKNVFVEPGTRCNWTFIIVVNLTALALQ